MKVKMSDAKAHGGLFACPKDAEWPTVAAHVAFAEARAILAETEPKQQAIPYLANPGCYAAADGLHCTGCMWPEHRAVLADALRAFVTDEGR